jgi:hypothetical protein
MISISYLNNRIKTRKFITTAYLSIKKRLNENLIDIIMNYTGFIKTSKEELKEVFGLIALVTNRIYYMYYNEIADWMNYYNHNNYQMIEWRKNKFDINWIVLELLKSYFKFNLTIISNNNFKLNEKTFEIKNKNHLIEIMKLE